MAASNARIGAAISEYYPKLSLSGLVGSATSVSSGSLFSGGASQATGVLGLRWRLFDFARINAQIEQAKGQEAEMLAAYRLAALRATEDVENSLSAFSRRQEQVLVLKAGVDSLDRARAASFSAYQKGVVSMIEVLHADETLLRAADARVQAQTESARSAVAIFKALGEGGSPVHLRPSPRSMATPKAALTSDEYGHIAYHRNGPVSSLQKIHRRTSAYGDVPMEYGSIPVSTRSRCTR